MDKVWRGSELVFRYLASSNPWPCVHPCWISYLFLCRAIFANESSRNLFFFLLLNLSFAFVELAYGIWTNRWLETHFSDNNYTYCLYSGGICVHLCIYLNVYCLVNDGCLYFLSVLVWSPIHFTCSLIVRRS